MSQLQDILDYYTNLLIIQYNDKQKARDTINLLIKTILPKNEETNNLLAFDVRNAFNIDTAEGKQLDIIGKYVGVDRFYQGQKFDDLNLFAFTTYTSTPTSNQKGFSTFSDFNTKDGETLTYDKIVSETNKLNDTDYRKLIKLKIIQNNIDHSHKSIDSALFDTFGGDIYASELNTMTMTYFLPDSDSDLLDAITDKDLFPRPMGVRIDYVITQSHPFFGFATYNSQSSLIQGFSTFADYNAKEGETLTYDKFTQI